MRIRKKYQVIPTNAKLENGDSVSETNGYVAEYINDHSVVVSAVEPSGSARKKVWKRHSSKNILKCKQGISSSEASVTVTTDYTGEALNYINVSKSSSTSENVFIEVSSFIFEYDTGNYILNGCPSGGSTNTYQLYFRDITLNTDVSPRDEGSGAEVNLTKGHQYTLYIRINASVTFTDKKFYPMLRLTTETDDTYEPYVDDKEYILNENNVYEEFNPNKGIVLYESDSRVTTGNINLYDDITNYKYLDIFYNDNNGRYSSTRVEVTVNRTVDISLFYSESNALYMKQKSITLKQNYIEQTTYLTGVISSNGSASTNTGNTISVMKVIGYK